MEVEPSVEIMRHEVLETWGCFGDGKFPDALAAASACKLYRFGAFLDALKGEVMRALDVDVKEIKFADEDFKLDLTQQEFRARSIGCQQCCPTCGRKCDQDVRWAGLLVGWCFVLGWDA